MTDLQTGEMAPDFSLPTGAGDDFNLSEHRGQIVVLYFYPKDDTAACTTEAVDFSRASKEFAAAGAIVVGVSPDSVARHGKFAVKHELTITLLADEEHVVINAYGVWVEKTLYGRKYMGVDRSTFLIGEDGRVLHVWRKVRARGHADAVLAQVKQLTCSALTS